jgi:hypothetical protein
MKLKLFLTFDHELPLGGVKSNWNDALFEPTKKLFDISKRLGVPIILFTDVLCALRFKQWDNNGFYKPYIAQLKDAVKRKHDVQLHLHPHWLTSGYDNLKFLPSNDFSLSDFSNKESEYTIESIVKDGITFLDENLKPEFSEYKCLAFRAGGYNLGIPSDTGRIIRSLHNHGIIYDSSISKGYYFKSGISKVDFRGMPREPNWYLDLNGNLSVAKDAGILEIPIASIPKSPFELPTMFKLKKYAYRAPQNRGYQIHEGKPAGYAHKFRQLFSSRMLGFDNYTYSHEYMMRILDYNVQKYRKYDEVLLSVSGHPKSMGEYSFELMQRFVENVRRKYPEAEFLTFTELAHQQNKFI